MYLYRGLSIIFQNRIKSRISTHYPIRKPKPPQILISIFFPLIIRYLCSIFKVFKVKSTAIRLHEHECRVGISDE
jgi:hypothetical protein